MAENETLAQGERTGIFTTGIVARGLDKTLAPIVLYASGRRHAGENMDQLLNQRTVQASKVIHMADASSMAPRSPLRITAKCMVHARRYFIEAEPAFPEHCDRVLEDIAAIYRNDDDTRGMDPDERLAYHQQHSRPIMDALYKWIEEQFRERVVEPNSRLGKAFSYVKNHWQGLTRFLEVPGVPLDNNVSEQELKPSQRHRKNSLFFRTQAGADVGDVLLSMPDEARSYDAGWRGSGSGRKRRRHVHRAPVQRRGILGGSERLVCLHPIPPGRAIGWCHRASRHRGTAAKSLTALNEDLLGHKELARWKRSGTNPRTTGAGFTDGWQTRCRS